MRNCERCAELEGEVERLRHERNAARNDADLFGDQCEEAIAKLEAIEARCRFPDSVGDLRDAIQRIISGDSDE